MPQENSAPTDPLTFTIMLTLALLAFCQLSFIGRVSNAAANKSLVGDPKSGTFSCVSPCVGELVFIVWSGAGRHNSTVSWLH